MINKALSDQEIINETVNNWKRSLKESDHLSTRRLILRQIDEIDMLIDGDLDSEEAESFRSMYPENFNSFSDLARELDNLLWS